MARVRCRLWWPQKLLRSPPEDNLLLFGWCLRSSPDSLDVVVAAGVPPDALLHTHVEEVLCHVNKTLPVYLLDHSSVSLMGHSIGSRKSEIMPNHYNNTSSGECNGQSSHLGTKYDENQENGQLLSKGPINAGDSSMECCGCYKLERNFDQQRQDSIGSGCWIQLIPIQGFFRKRVRWIPKLDHIHQNGQVVSVCQLHIILYEPPTFGNHHFSWHIWNSWLHEKVSITRPNWFNKLHKQNRPRIMDLTLLALNCSNIVEECVKGSPETISSHNQIRFKLAALFWNIIAVIVASASTILYIVLQLCHKFLACCAHSFPLEMFKKLFRHSWKNLNIRCNQILYWSVFLQGCSSSYSSNVEYLHKAAIRRHAIWVSTAVDVLLGNMGALYLLNNIETVCIWISVASSYITNNLLRSGCVWLMGVPAGFKLNTELAELLGMVSLNAIQVWSTLWFFVSLAFQYIIIGLAVSGMFLGLTVPAALCIDLLELAAMHIAALHWLISFIYSLQIQALASLWRLFRGKKWNPLRQRLDTFDYTVEEHIVGSLLFTPILLLLPTTTVFYIFMTIMSSIAKFVCGGVEITIDILHATPHAEIFLWIFRKGRFPSGVWFEYIRSQSLNTSSFEPHNDCLSSYLGSSNRVQNDYLEPGSSISVLRSNFASIGQILRPPLRKALCRFSLSYGKTLLHRALSGQRTQSIPQTRNPPTMPWINLSSKEYWTMCHTSVRGYY